MAKTVKLIERLSVIVMCVSVVGGVAGMWTSVQASNNSYTMEKIKLESRLIRLETKVDMIIDKLSK